MRVLGLAFSGHGSSIALVEDGRIACAVNLERLTREKFSLATLPADALSLGGLLVQTYQLTRVPRVFNFFEVFPLMLEYVTGETDLKKAGIDLVVKTQDNIRPPTDGNEDDYAKFLKLFASTRTHFDLEHHLCHAYQAFLCSPFEDAAVLTIDGQGELLERLANNAVTTALNVAEGNRVSVLLEVLVPSSIGGMYSNFTKHLGFQSEQEGNTMALAAFGTDRFHKLNPDVWVARERGDFELTFRNDLTGMVFVDRMRAAVTPRNRGDPLTQDHYDLAWWVQAVTEQILVHAARGLQSRTGKTRLAMAGGVALNCVANAKILTDTPFEEIYVMPNAGDRGLAVGAALWGHHVLLGRKERHPPVSDYFGRTYSEADTVAALESAATVEWQKSDDIEKLAAQLIADGRIIGWHQGGCEFGPRALGHRSILADPRTAKSKERLDADIKRREWFRPYAPSVLAEHADEYFEMHGPSPYMLQAVNTRPAARSRVPGIVHVDGSARVQTVEQEIEPRYHRLISLFKELTGVPLVLNTSFNGYGEPMVETPEDAVACLNSMNLDALVIGDHICWPAGRRPW
jgi:carbamoyltransferase